MAANSPAQKTYSPIKTIDIATIKPYKRMVSQQNKQSSFAFAQPNKLKSNFGSSTMKSNPKTARPISTKDLMHVVLKSELATGPRSLLRFERNILALVRELALKLNVRVMDAVVMSNHLHLALRVYRRRAFQDFLRALSGLIARLVLGAERSRRSDVGFFKGRPFSRIVASGKKSFQIITDYFKLNRLEKQGFTKAEGRRLGLLDGVT